MPDGVELRYRSGATRLVPPGSWLVNCTGYLFRNEEEYEPYVSPGGRTVSINNRSATAPFSSFAGYCLTHLSFRGKLSDAPLYEADFGEVKRVSPQAGLWVALTLAMYNSSVIYDAVPPKVMLGCGVDFDRWSPLPHRMLSSLQFVRTHRTDREHHRRTLDTVRERFGVRCGPLATPVLR